MSEAADPEVRLAGLRRRLEAEPSSRVFLQLAEELRRHGQLAEAVEVLEGGLAANPGYLSAHVALARCRLELGQPEVAEPMLLRVLGQDPTQLVAMKLLVQTYVALGRAADAAEWLDRYSLLAGRDDEATALRERIRGLDAPAVAPAAMEAPERTAQPLVAPAAGSEFAPSVTADPGSGQAAEETTNGELFHLGAFDVPALALGPYAARPQGPLRPFRIVAPVRATRLRDPFPHHGLAVGAGLWGDLFAVAETAAASEAAVVESPVAAVPAVEEASPSPELPAVVVERTAAEVELWALLVAPPVAESAELVEASAAELEGPVVEPFVQVAEAEAPAVESVAELAGVAEPAADVAQPELAAFEAPEPSPAELEVRPEPELEPEREAGPGLEAEPEPEPEPVEEAPVAVPAAVAPTVTLAALYFAQGHLDEAADMYRRVLDREPWNREAHLGLRQALEAARPPVDAIELLRGFRPADGGLTAKKMHVLRSYLLRLGRG